MIVHRGTGVHISCWRPLPGTKHRCDARMRSLPNRPVFTRAELRVLGWSNAAITRAIRSGRLIRIRRGLLAARDHPHATAIAATASCGGSVISHRSALLMHGLPIVGQDPSVPELTVAPRGAGSLVRAHLYRASLPPEHITSRNGTPITTVARTLIDIGRDLPRTTAVAAIDAALRRELVDEDDINEVLLRCWNWPGIRRAQRAVRLADGRADSPLETVSRLTMGRLGLPEPEPQVLILDEHIRVVAQVDFYWDEFGMVGEADGRSKYDDRQVLTAEKVRQELLEDLRVVVVRWGWDQPTRKPELFRERLESGFERGRARDRSGLRRLWSVAAP